MTNYNKHDSGLPIKIIIAVKALFIYIFFSNYGLINPFSYSFPFLPFVPILDSVPTLIYQVLSIILGIAIVMPFFVKKYYQEAALTAGIILILFILSSKPLFSNSLTFAACLLILIGLFKNSECIFRIQISLLYVGAGINKLFSPDWWNGIFISFLLDDVYQSPLYQFFVFSIDIDIARYLGVSIIFLELFLGVAVLIPRFTQTTIATGFIFHGGMLLMTLGALSVHFFYLMAVGFLLISNYTIKPLIISGAPKPWVKWLTIFDASDSIYYEHPNRKKISTIADATFISGKDGIKRLLLSHQTLVFLCLFFSATYFILPKLIKTITP